MGIRVLVENSKDTAKPVETVSKRFSKIGDRVGGGPGPHYPYTTEIQRWVRVANTCVTYIYIYYTYTRDICTHAHGERSISTHKPRSSTSRHE